MDPKSTGRRPPHQAKRELLEAIRAYAAADSEDDQAFERASEDFEAKARDYFCMVGPGTTKAPPTGEGR